MITPSPSGMISSPVAVESAAVAVRKPFSVRIKKWKAVATWHWHTGNDEELCGICRLKFDYCCPDCKSPGDDCPLIVGKCTHCFHMHCLLKWIQSPQSHQKCPMDRRPWETAS